MPKKKAQAPLNRMSRYLPESRPSKKTERKATFNDLVSSFQEQRKAKAQEMKK